MKESMKRANDADVMAVDHVGFSVSSLDQAIDFWTGVMGFELVRRSEMGGAFLREATGVDDPRCRMALIVAPNGFPIELLEYSTGPELGRVPDSAGSIGATHLKNGVRDNFFRENFSPTNSSRSSPYRQGEMVSGTISLSVRGKELG